MISNYIKVAFRNLIRFKAYSAINITGLAIGMACCILILLYVYDEMSYDRFNKNSNRIYRVVVDGSLGDNSFKVAVTSPPLRKTLLQDYPEVEAVTRIRNFGFPVLRFADKVFSEEKFYWVDSTFFDVFSGDFIKGDPKTALTQPLSVVLTEKMAKKYFGNENPMGKLLNMDKATLSGILDRMNEAGWLRKEQDLNDMRVFRIFPSRKANELEDTLRREREAANDELLSGFTCDEKILLRRLLMEII